MLLNQYIFSFIAQCQWSNSVISLQPGSNILFPSFQSRLHWSFHDGSHVWYRCLLGLFSRLNQCSLNEFPLLKMGDCSFCVLTTPLIPWRSSQALASSSKFHILVRLLGNFLLQLRYPGSLLCDSSQQILLALSRYLKLET